MRVRGFGELEADIMDRIWNRGDAAVTVRGGVRRARRGAPDRLHHSHVDDGQPAHEGLAGTRSRRACAYRYWPTLNREQHSAQLMREALDGGGRSDLVLSYFIEQIDPQDSDRLRAALRTLARRSARPKKR